MLTATRSRSRWTTIGLLSVIAASAALWWQGPALERASVLQRLSVLAAGGHPLAEPFAREHVDQTFAESPLVVSLGLEEAFAPMEREEVLAFADALARDLGFWLLETTGAPDVEEAERRLWSEGDPDRLAVAWALRLQARHLYARHTQRLSGATAPYRDDPRYAHPDELALLFAHVAWRLDLATDLVRSPVHHYFLLREPGGTRARGVEPTCFRRVDALGRVVKDSDEPSVGRRLTFPPDHYPSGVGGIRNPVPLPKGSYAPVTAAELTGDLFARLAARYDADAETLDRQLAADPTVAVARAIQQVRLARGIAAWQAGEARVLAEESRALAELRSTHGALLDDAPDERALDAAVAFAAGARARGFDGIHAVLRYHEPDGVPLFAKNDAHAMAMWLELEYGLPTPEDWNRRIVPLLNRNRSDPAQIAKLCGIGRKVLANTEQTVEGLVPECAR